MKQPLVTIGLEVHVQLNTNTKLFSNSLTQFGQQPNSQTNEVDIGLPGTLPVINEEAVKKAIQFGLAIDATVNDKSIFARKNYFYPDLPKSYQITQEAYPIVSDGHLKIDSKTIRIARAHLEEDAGKSIHDKLTQYTLIDLNRSGQPLLEIVTEPDITSSQEAIAYLKKLHHLVRYINITDGNMQEGSFRCDANVSIRYDKADPLGTRVEIKNLNSFKFIEKAIDFEIQRQHMQLMNNEPIIQETRLYNENSNQTISMRKKENADDYRYFSDPDLPVLIINSKMMEEARSLLPVLPEVRYASLIEQGISESDASLVVSTIDHSNYYDNCMLKSDSKSSKLIINWMFGDLAALMNKSQLSINTQPIKPQQLATIIDYIEAGKISQPMAKEILSIIWNEPSYEIDTVMQEKGLSLNNNEDEVLQMITEVLDENPNQLSQYLSGKDKLYGYFVGQMMKKTKGKVSPEIINKLLQTELHKKGSNE